MIPVRPMLPQGDTDAPVNPLKQVTIAGQTYTVTFDNQDQLYQLKKTDYESRFHMPLDTATKAAIVSALNKAARQPTYGTLPTGQLDPQEIANTQQKGTFAEAATPYSDWIIGGTKDAVSAILTPFADVFNTGTDWAADAIVGVGKSAVEVKHNVSNSLFWLAVGVAVLVVMQSKKG